MSLSYTNVTSKQTTNYTALATYKISGRVAASGDGTALSGATPFTVNGVANSAGRATFPGLVINNAGNGYTLKATWTLSGFGSGTFYSYPFNVTVSAPETFVQESQVIASYESVNLSLPSIDTSTLTAETEHLYDRESETPKMLLGRLVFVPGRSIWRDFVKN